MPDVEADRAAAQVASTDMSTPHRYSIKPKDPVAHLYEISVTVEQPDAEGQIFAVPAWIPGSYIIRDYARHVVAIRAESDEREVALTKLDKSRWQAEIVSRPLTLVAEIYAYDPSVRGAHLDTTHAYFNGTCVFPAVVGHEQMQCELRIVPPDAPFGNDWRVATSMRRKDAAEYGFGIYTAVDYAELVDHPVEIANLSIGEFEVNGIPHAIAIRGHTRTDMARICHDLQTLCAQHLLLLGVPDGLDRYLFLLHAPGSGYAGLEHRWSSSLICARDNLPVRGDTDVSNGYRRFLGLASHEYFHLWNVKRMKPAAFTPYDLSAETYTGLLWVFEGVTSYYDDLALVRAGLITESSYLELVGRTITRVSRGRGRLRQSVEEASFDVWTKLYKQDANASNAIVSYYAKGSLIALSLDLKLRAETEYHVSLDGVMQECWRRWGDSADGMPEHGFETVCDEVSGLELGDFFDAAVRGTGDLPLESLLRHYGVSFNVRASSGSKDKGGKNRDPEKRCSVWLGATLAADGGDSVFKTVSNGGPAELAGIAPGDRAVALDGVRLTASNADRRLRAYFDGDVLELVAFRGDELITASVCLTAPPEDTCYLELIGDIDAETFARRAAWLHG